MKNEEIIATEISCQDTDSEGKVILDESVRQTSILNANAMLQLDNIITYLEPQENY